MVYLGETNTPPEVSNDLDEEQKEFARSVFAGTAKDDAGGVIPACYYCGGIHTRVVGLIGHGQLCCPRIRSVQHDVSGVLLSVEFWPNGEWESGVIFPADVSD